MLELIKKISKFVKNNMGLNMKFWISISLIFGINYLFAQRQIDILNDTAYVEDLMKLQQLMGLQDNAYDIKNYMINRFRTMANEVDSVYWANLSNSIDISEYLRMNALTFASVFSREEIKELLKFYESPLGRKVVLTMEAIHSELANNEGLWAESIRVIILKKLQEDGLIDYYELKPEDFEQNQENNDIEIK